ncbi:MAG: hypothetical protein HY078_06670 [Elusimicrobia bacterium]|nr:hypothetical protein [Elusimicrobiota bacterium]
MKNRQTLLYVGMILFAAPPLRGQASIDTRGLPDVSVERVTRISTVGVNGIIRLERSISLDEPARLALISTDTKGEPYVSLILTESNRVLAKSRWRGYREVFRTSKSSDKVYALPDPYGRSMAINADGAAGGFFLFDKTGRTIAKVPQLKGYKYIDAEPVGPTMVSHPTGGWAGWPSLWNQDGSRKENMKEGWPQTQAVRSVKFSAGGRRIAVLSSEMTHVQQFTISVFSTNGKLIWRSSTTAERPWSTANIVYSKSGDFLAAASRTRFTVYDSSGGIAVDLPIPTQSEQHIHFSADETYVSLASADVVRLINIPKGKIEWETNLKEVGGSKFFQQGSVHVNSVMCSSDGRSVITSGLLQVRVPWVDPGHGIRSEKVDSMLDFVAVVREGEIVDIMNFPPGTLLIHLALNEQGAALVEVSGDGNNVIVPSRQTILNYAFPHYQK